MRVATAIVFVSAALVLLSLTSCAGKVEAKTTFTVEGMHCDSCSSAITQALESKDGVVSASADHESGLAEAVHRTSAVTAEALKATIENLGYTVTGVSSAPLA